MLAATDRAASFLFLSSSRMALPSRTRLCSGARPQASSDCSTSGRGDQREGKHTTDTCRIDRRTFAAALASSAAMLPRLVSPESSRAADGDAISSSADFYSKWSYVKPSDILPYLDVSSTPGDVPSIIRAMDAFAEKYPMYKLSHEKGELLGKFVREAKPKLALEVGTFLGYSALWTASNLPPGGRLVCVEASRENAEVARAVLRLGKVDDRVEIVVGLGSSVIPTLPEALAGPSGGAAPAADFVFLDHCKECYLKDLNALEERKLVRKGTVLVADNVIYPGAPDFLQWVDTAQGRYETKLFEAVFEYEQVWNKDWTLKKKDAMSYSVRVAPV